MTNDSDIDSDGIAATFEGLKVPESRYVLETRANQISKGRYERPELEFAREIIGADDRILELGAGIGFVGGFTAYSKPGTILRSFEANPDLIAHIEKLYEINDLTDRASVENLIVMSSPERPEDITFHVHGSFLGSSLFQVGGPHRPKPKIKTIAWDDVVSEFKPSILLMDIEGGELDLLKHADLTGIRAVILELHPRHYGEKGVNACVEALTAQGLEQRAQKGDVRVFERSDT